MAERHATKGDDGRFRREAVEERFPGRTAICHSCGGRVIWRRNERDDWIRHDADDPKTRHRCGGERG